MTPSESELVNFLQTTSKDSLIAGDPCSLDFVPMMAGRQILFSCEFLPSGRTEQQLDLLRAYYADSLSEVLGFCEEFGIDYFVVRPSSYDISDRIFYEPYNSLLYTDVVSQMGYVLEDIPEGMRTFEHEDIVVMQCLSNELGNLSFQATQVDGLGVVAFDELALNLSQSENDFDMTVKWVAQKPLSEDYDLCFAFSNSSDETKHEICQPLSTNLPTSQWTIPEIRYETYNITVGPYLDAGDYSITISVRTDGQDHTGDGIPVGEFAYSALPRSFIEAGEYPNAAYDIAWGDAIALAKYDLSETTQGEIELYVRWHVLSRLAESHKIFVHIRRAGLDEIVSQTDTIARNWTYPTNWWEINEIITDTILIPVNDVGQGSFDVWIGLYDEESGRRLPFSGAADLSLPMKDEAIKILEFER